MKSNVIFVNSHTLLQSKDFVVVLDKILIPEDEHEYEYENENEYEDVCQLSTVDNARSKKPVRVAPPPRQLVLQSKFGEVSIPPPGAQLTDRRYSTIRCDTSSSGSLTMILSWLVKVMTVSGVDCSDCIFSTLITITESFKRVTLIMVRHLY